MVRCLVVDVRDMGALERQLAETGTSLTLLMRKAGAATANAVLDSAGLIDDAAPYDAGLIDDAVPYDAGLIDDAALDGFVCEPDVAADFSATRVAILAGVGNNGGDGWVAAETLAEVGCDVVLAALVSPHEMKAEPARSEAVRIAARVDAGELPFLRVLVAPDTCELRSSVLTCDFAIDALLGVGFAGDSLRDPLRAWADVLNEARSTGTFVVSADVPSGLNAQTGHAVEGAVKADATVTMIACKPGMLLPSAKEFVGKLACADLGVGAHAETVAERMGFAREYASLLDEVLLKRLRSYVYEAVEPPMMCAAMAEPYVAGAGYGRILESPSLSDGYAQPSDLKQLFDTLDEPFSTTLLRIIDERGFTDAQVYKRAQMSRQLFSKIRSDSNYRPAKKTVLALAIALELSLEETCDLLERAGFALSHANRVDVIVKFFIENQMYDLFLVNEALYAFDLPTL